MIENKPKVWVCMLTHNRSKVLHTALKMPAFARGLASYAGREDTTLFIQAQACTDDTWDWLQHGVDWLPACHVITHQIDFNLWAIGGRHRQIDWLVHEGGLRDDDVVIFLDDDIRIVGSDWITMFVEGLLREDFTQIGAVGIDGKTYDPGWNQSTPITDGPWPMRVDVVGGGWMAVWGEVLRQGANYDLAQLPFWGGDDDFCLHIRSLGYEVLSLGPQEVSGLCHEPAHTGDDTWNESQRRLIRKWRGKAAALKADKL